MYASAYAAKVFYDLENTLLRNGEKYIQQNSIFHMENGGPWAKSGVIPTDSAFFCPS